MMIASAIGRPISVSAESMATACTVQWLQHADSSVRTEQSCAEAWSGPILELVQGVAGPDHQ